MRSFEDRVVVVTGAGSGIGRAVARRFAEEGARLALLDREPAGIAALADDVRRRGGRALAETCDVADPEQVAATFRTLREKLGAIDVLVNNAGITHRSRFVDTDPSVYRRVMDVNLFGCLHCTQAALPSLLERKGLVIVLSSIAGVAALPGRSGYCASKHALHGLFETLRCELRGSGVQVMLVCPGFTATAIEKHALGPDGRPSERPQSRVGREATPEAVAEAIVRGAQAGRRLVVLSPAGRAARHLSRLAPGLYERAMARLFRSELEGEDPQTDSARSRTRR